MPLPPHINERAAWVAELTTHANAREILKVSGATLPKRLFLSALLLTPGAPEALFRHFILKPYEKVGKVIGKGATALVVQDSDTTVRKFFLSTDHLTEKQQETQMAKWQAKQDLSLLHMEKFVVPQQLAIEEHPIFPERGSIITATQAFTPYESAINIYDEAFRRGTWFPADFYAASRAMYEFDPSALPDVIGIDNIVFDEDGKLRVIDPIALTEEEDGPYYQKAARAFNFPERPSDSIN